MGTILDAIAGLPPWLVLGLVFLLPALEASTFIGIVVPGEIAVLVGGVIAHTGSLPLWAVVVAASLGAVLGDNVGYQVGHRFGPTMLDRLPKRLVAAGDLDRALDVVRRRGAIAVITGRWVAALRALIPGVAGMSEVPMRRFVLANLVGGVTWATAIALIGYGAGAGYRTAERRLGLGSEILLGVLVILVVIWVLRSRHRRRTGADG
jgi:membrane-associated protein